VSLLAKLVKPYREARAAYIRGRYGFGRKELLNAIRSAGIQPGDASLVHSGFSSFEPFEGKITDIVSTFQEAVSPDGTLMMPTLSIAGSTVDFANSGSVFDPRTTPSQAGVITEVFRSCDGVVRSVHPTHSVAVWGKDKDWWNNGHHLAGTPCGRGTPFHRLIERDGKVALAGTGIETLTFFHCIEELIEPRMPFSPFTTERYTMQCRVGGNIVETAPMRLFDPALSRRRDLRPLETELREKGRWREGTAEALTIIVLKARDVLATIEDMASRGVFCYRSE
jgi:aminoglycoside N3'-acetyltransferase